MPAPINKSAVETQYTAPIEPTKTGDSTFNPVNVRNTAKSKGRFPKFDIKRHRIQLKLKGFNGPKEPRISNNPNASESKIPSAIARDNIQYYTPDHIEKREYLESLATPISEEKVCFCFKEKNLINNFVNGSLDPVQWGLINEKPGIQKNRLGGRGLYVAEPRGLQQASRYAGRMKQAGKEPGLMTVHIDKGAKFLDFTDKSLLSKLASKWGCSFKEAEHLVSYLEPRAVCKFSDKDWLVIKSLDNVQFRHPSQDDFESVIIRDNGKFDPVAKELIDSFENVKFSKEKIETKSPAKKVKTALSNHRNYSKTDLLNKVNEDKFISINRMNEYINDYGNDNGYSLYIAETINQYFSKKYQGSNIFDKLTPRVRNQKTSRYIDGRKVKVYRPKHALAHGVRQGALSKDILELLSNKRFTGEMADWARSKLSSDPDFLKKVEFMSCFMRTGRKSEASTESRFYASFLRRDANNFQRAASNTTLFDKDELETFRMALQPTQDGPINSDAQMLKLLTKTAHRLDLRRLPHFDKDRVQLLVASSLYGQEFKNLSDLTTTQRNGLNVLWSRSGDYLRATGDRDLDVRGRNNFQNEFFTQAKNPLELVQAVNGVRSQSSLSDSRNITPLNTVENTERDENRAQYSAGIDAERTKADPIKRVLDQYGIDDNRDMLAELSNTREVDAIGPSNKSVSETGLYVSKRGVNQYGDFDFVTPKTAKSYHTTETLKVQFTGEALDELQKTYKKTPVTGFLKKFINQQDGAEYRNYLSNTALCDYLPPVNEQSNGHLIYPNPTYINDGYFTAPEKLKDSRNGIQLLTWAVHPKNSAPLVREISKGKYHTEDKASSGVMSGLYTNSQFSTEKKTGLKSLTTILDLTKEDLPQLKALKEASQKQLIDKYKVDIDQDKVSMFFHFPVSIETATLHLHIFVNKGNLPLNEQRSFTLDEIIKCLETGGTIKELILNRNNGEYYFPKKNINSMPGMPKLEASTTPKELIVNLDKAI